MKNIATKYKKSIVATFMTMVLLLIVTGCSNKGEIGLNTGAEETTKSHIASESTQEVAEQSTEAVTKENTELVSVEHTDEVVIENESSASGEYYPFYNESPFSREDFTEQIVQGVNSKYTISKDWNYTFAKPNIGEYFVLEAGEYKTNPNGNVYGFEDGMTLGCSSWCGMKEYKYMATASSTLPAVGKVTYVADNLVGDDRGTVWSGGAEGGRGTAWSEGVEGAGIGESVTITQQYKGGSEPWLIYKEICVVNGYASNETTWSENNRVKKMKLYFGDAYMGSITLEDTIKPQYIDISALKMKVVSGEEAKFRLEIEEVYKGTKYDDTCLTGIIFEFDGRVAH